LLLLELIQGRVWNLDFKLGNCVAKLFGLSLIGKGQTDKRKVFDFKVVEKRVKRKELLGEVEVEFRGKEKFKSEVVKEGKIGSRRIGLLNQAEHPSLIGVVPAL